MEMAYTEEQIPDFADDVSTVVNEFFAISPYAEYFQLL